MVMSNSSLFFSDIDECKLGHDCQGICNILLVDTSAPVTKDIN